MVYIVKFMYEVDNIEDIHSVYNDETDAINKVEELTKENKEDFFYYYDGYELR